MPTLTKAGVGWNGLLRSLVGLIEEEWNPAPQREEAAYRDSLIEFLRQNLPDDARVEPEFRHLGTTSDIYLDWPGLVFDDEVFFEIKRALTDKGELDRLVGQLESLKPDRHKIILVLIEECKTHFIDRLRRKYARQLDETVDRMRIAQVMPRKG